MMGSPVNPKVSVAMVTYNHAQFIRTAISSVLSQETNFPFELVVGDDCSTDGTTEIVRALSAAHPDVIRVLHRERNIGASKNFQDVLDNCRGQYIAILDGDDYWTAADKLQIQSDYLDANPDTSMVFHRVRCLLSQRDLKSQWPHETVPAEECHRARYSLDDLLLECFPVACSTMCRNRPNLLPTWHTRLAWGDWTLHVMNAIEGAIGFIDREMATYRVHAGGITRRFQTAKFLRQRVLFYDLLRPHLPVASLRRLRQARAIALAKLIIGCVKRGKKKEAWVHLKTLLGSTPWFVAPRSRIQALTYTLGVRR